MGPDAGVEPSIDVTKGFPTEVANVQATFNGTPGPLFYVQGGQINAIAPWSLQSGQNVDVCVVYNGAKTNCLTMTAAAAHSGVFTTDGYHAAALNQDGTINSPSNPAAVGSVVSVFATGLGAITPLPADGEIVGVPLPKNLMAVTVQPYSPPLIFGNTQPQGVTVNYGGPAPYEVAGVSQVNFVVPNTGSLPLVLQPGATNQCCGFTLFVGQQ